MAEEIKAGDAPKEKVKVPISKVKFDKKGQYVFLRLSLMQLHEAVGILEDLKADILDMIRIPRKLEAQARAARRQQLAGGDGVLKGAKKNKNFMKKLFGK